MKRFLSFLPLLILLASCETNPITGRKQFMLLSESDEIQLGQEWGPGLLDEMGGVYCDPALSEMVSDVGNRLVAHLPAIAKEENYSTRIQYHFYVVNDSMVNAFALLGGHVFFTRGILMHLPDEDALAAVMGHEIMHIAGRHTAEELSRRLILAPLGDAALLLYALKGLHYSRQSEAQSDKYGLRLMVAAGYNPRGMVDLFDIFKRLEGGKSSAEWLSSHPLSEDRYQDALRRAEGDYAEACARSRSKERFDRSVALARQEKPFYDEYDAGLKLFEKKDYAGAIDRFSRAIAGKQDALFYMSRGRAFARLSDYARAEEDLSGAITLNPRLMQPWLMRGIIRTAGARWWEAAGDLREAIKRVDTSKGRYFLGLSCEGLSDFGGAREAYKRCLELEKVDMNEGPGSDAADHVKQAWQRLQQLR